MKPIIQYSCKQIQKQYYLIFWKTFLTPETYLEPTQTSDMEK